MSGGFDPEYFPKLAELEAGNFWFRSRNRLIVWALEKYFPNCKKLLEIGCGTGFVLDGIRQNFPEIELFGSEFYKEALTLTSKRLPKATLLQMDARNIPFSSEFDVIGAFDVLEHIEEDQKVLEEMHRALKPQGGILITVPQHPFLWSQFDEFSHHVRRYRQKDLCKKIEDAGFKILRKSSFVSLLMPALLASRIKKKNATTAYDGMAELKKPAPINFMLERTLSFERQWIRAGVSFPFGGSLFVAAQKK